MRPSFLITCGFALIPIFATTAAPPFVPNLGPDRATITVTAGEITLLFRQSSQWTPGRIDYLGTPMTTERSAYGTVFSFPDVGFIGTGHLENEPENLKSLAFILDGKEISEPGESLSGKQFRFVRESSIRNFDLKGEIEMKDDRLYETSTFSTVEAAPLKLVYHFMHAWTPTVTAFIAGKDDAPEESIAGPLTDGEKVNRKFYIQQRVDWMAVYEAQSGQFAVSRLLEAPELGEHVSMIWNVPGTYRKFYLKCFNNQTVPAGFQGTWKMVTAFGKSDTKNWEASARRLADELRESK